MNMPRSCPSRRGRTLAVAMLLLGLSVLPLGALAEAPQLNPAFTIADNLAALTGRTATVHLSSGQSLTGVVKEVGTHLLHLEKIAQREFFDAVIRIESISAVETRAR